MWQVELIIRHLFFFKQKTAYEMRISDWSSDVCSSDLRYQVDVRVNETDGWKRVEDVKTWGFDTSEEEDFFEWPISVFKPEMRFKPVRASYVRVKILKMVAPPAIHAFEIDRKSTRLNYSH